MFYSARNPSYISSMLLIPLCVCLYLWCLVIKAEEKQETLLNKTSQALHITNISYDSMLKDITYLASDKLKGRGNFSSEINEAATYIAQRFKTIGLQPLPNSKNFYQTFSIERIKPDSISVVINEQNIPTQNIAFISHAQKKQWQNTQHIHIKYVTEKDDFHKSLNAYNQAGGEYLVLIHPAHTEVFNRYKTYFNQSKSQLLTRQNTTLSKQENNKRQHSLILVLSDVQKVEQINIHLTTEQNVFQLKNVVGVLPASKKLKDSTTTHLLFSAHYDHLGINDQTQAIYNGADDDASGTTAIIQLAEFYAQQKDNTRPIIFAAFAAEELGILGSNYFSKQIPPESIAAMFNIEMIGKPSKFGAGKLWMTGYDKSELFTLLNKGKPKNDLAVYPDPYPEQTLFYRSDNAPLARLGVPAHSFSSSQIDIDPHYHQISDKLSSLNLEAMYQVIDNLSRITQPLAQGAVAPARIEAKTLKRNGKIF